MSLHPAIDIDRARVSLAEARGGYYEDPAGVLAVAVRCYEIGAEDGDEEVRARASALQGMGCSPTSCGSRT